MEAAPCDSRRRVSVGVIDARALRQPAAPLAGQLVRIFLAVRVGALAEAVATGCGHLPWLTASGRAWVIAVFAVENVMLLAVVGRTRRIPAALLVFDTVTLAGTTAAVARLSTHPGGWENWPFSFATVAVFGIGAACRSGRLFGILLAMVTALYGWLEFVEVREALVPGGIDMLTVVSNLLIGFGAGWALRRRVAELAALYAA